MNGCAKILCVLLGGEKEDDFEASKYSNSMPGIKLSLAGFVVEYSVPPEPQAAFSCSP